MTIRLNMAARNACLGDASGTTLKTQLNLGFLWLFSGSQPADANTGATSTCLGKVTISNAGTGLTMINAAGGVLAKTVAEVWQFHGLVNGTVGWYRLTDSSDDPTQDVTTTHPRVDGLVATAGGDANMSNTTVVAGAVSTIDSFSFTMPANA